MESGEGIRRVWVCVYKVRRRPVEEGASADGYKTASSAGSSVDVASTHEEDSEQEEEEDETARRKRIAERLEQ